ncbi:hypothetical protein BDZ89DRAFT_1076631 [Hymenopellis radicata]|nr:hypothetical protein BDZ89DRAFT_1076631 [Hymenopellis radicata]
MLSRCRCAGNQQRCQPSGSTFLYGRDCKPANHTWNTARESGIISSFLSFSPRPGYDFNARRSRPDCTHQQLPLLTTSKSGELYGEHFWPPVEHRASPVLRHDDACHTLPELKARSSLGQILFGTWPFMLQLRWSKAKDDNIAPDDFGSPPDTLAVPGAFKLAHSSCQTPLERPS